MIWRRWQVIAVPRENAPSPGAAKTFAEEVNRTEHKFLLRSSAMGYAYDMNSLFHPIVIFQIVDRRGNQ